ncbi:MAG: septum formation inhibitor Maf [Clostridia bacterium]|nr:septum formation inhibitor Maf [Clostridia bacterium]
MKLILASASPRRKELLKNAGYEYEVCPADIDETMPQGVEPETACEILSRKKAQAVLEENPDAVVLGSDTIVVLGNTILGKPENEEDAKAMLRALSGRVHQVYTGLCVCGKDKTLSLVSRADVRFYNLSDAVIDAYIATKEPMDKAGAYGIQGVGSMLVKSIEGDYFTIVGLPLSKAARMLGEFGIKGYLPFEEE